MEHGASRSLKEELQAEMTIKTEVEDAATSTVHSHSEIELNSLKPEPGFVHSVKREPALLVKEEIHEDGSRDSCEEQWVYATATPDGTSGVNETCSTSLSSMLNVKYESEDIDIGPTVLQHMDVHYTINKQYVSNATEEHSIGDDCYEAMLCGGVKKGSAEDKWGDSLTPQNAIMKERSVREHQLASDCRVHVTKLVVFECDICHAVYTDKLGLQQHLHSMHTWRPQTSMDAKVRKTNKRTAADNKVTSQNCAQTTTEMDYDEAHMKSHVGFKCDRMFRKPRLMSARNKLHQQNSGKVVTTKGTVADHSNYSGDKDNKTKQKPYACDVCAKRYSSKAGLNFHKSSHLVQLKNNFVNYEFHTRKKYHRELTKNMGNAPFQCKICHTKFVHRSDLTTHMRNHTGKKPYECDACHATFARNFNLTTHMRVHTGEKPYECDTCHAKFAQKGDLTKHTKVHTGEKLYQCQMCDKKFSERSNLTTHMRVHTGEKPYECNTCHAKFAQSGVLTNHMRVHTGEKPYDCDACHAKFSERSTLIKHMRVHTGEKPYECNVCHVKFTQTGDLTEHKKVHTGEKPYECDTCHAKFARRGGLTMHMRVHTGEKPYECDTCHAKFARRSGYTTHMRIHTGEKPYECMTCHAKFAQSSVLTKHMRVHTSEKPYECDTCHATFARRSGYASHMRVHTR